MKKNYFKRWGFSLGGLSVVWYDLWDKKFMLEILYKGRTIERIFINWFWKLINKEINEQVQREPKKDETEGTH